SSSAAAEELPQSLSGTACVVGEIANTASSSVVDESSKLPKASGCAPLPMVKGFERDDGTGAANSSSGDVAEAGSGGGGTTRGEGAGSDFAATGIGGGGVGTTGAPNTTPARVSADFTMEISGSGGTNGFFKTPSAPTRCASCSSRGSNAPTSKITGMCASLGSVFTYWQTSYPFRTGMKTSASTKSGIISEIFRTAASPLPTATTSMP